MTIPPYDDDYAGDDYDDGTCPECEGEGHLLTCVDDICRGLGYCMHDTGGYSTCHFCDGSGSTAASRPER